MEPIIVAAAFFKNEGSTSTKSSQVKLVFMLDTKETHAEVESLRSVTEQTTFKWAIVAASVLRAKLCDNQPRLYLRVMKTTRNNSEESKKPPKSWGYSVVEKNERQDPVLFLWRLEINTFNYEIYLILNIPEQHPSIEDV